MIERKIVYFEKSLPNVNTEATLQVSKERALEAGIKSVVVASGTGTTGVKAAELFMDTGIQIVVVTEHAGAFKFPTATPLLLHQMHRKRLEELGARIVTANYAFYSALESHPKFGGNIIISDTLKRFSQGMKTAVEVSMMAADAGAVPTNEDVIAVAGTLEGCDTAIIVKPCYTSRFFHKEKGIEIKQIIAMPICKVFYGPEVPEECRTLLRKD